jgi:hypothetical protein
VPNPGSSNTIYLRLAKIVCCRQPRTACSLRADSFGGDLAIRIQIYQFYSRNHFGDREYTELTHLGGRVQITDRVGGAILDVHPSRVQHLHSVYDVIF